MDSVRLSKMMRRKLGILPVILFLYFSIKNGGENLLNVNPLLQYLQIKLLEIN